MSSNDDLFQLGNFTPHSGKKSFWKIECDNLSQEEWGFFAQIIHEKHPHYQSVEGVPRGGLALAANLSQWSSGDMSDPILIVDDVLSTGASMGQQRAGRSNCIGVVVFSRAATIPAWIEAIFTLTF
jgi:hypothetical protein